MDYEQIRRTMKREIKPHRDGTAPKNAFSTNRLNALANTAELKYGSSAAKELHKEFTSKRK